MTDFSSFDLSPALKTALTDLGFTTPTPIQAQTLPLLLGQETDFLGLAATGTGKTAAYGIPLLERLNSSRRETQSLVLCPTRELAIQVTEQLNLLGKHKKLRAVAIYGGAGYGDQMRGLKQGAQIVVATPGRLIDHLERGTLKLDQVETIILDEADEMISMGFKDSIEAILEQLPEDNYNTWLFSATMSREVRKVSDRYLSEPKTVQVNKTEMLSGTVEQIYYRVRESDKPDVLCKLIDMTQGEFYGLIFCQTKSLVVDLTTLLNSRGYAADSLHGDKDQNQRERTMRAFRERKVNVVVCTDVACRGLDVKDLTHVVNYSIPRELDNYVHRIGRTGRSGKSGLALSLVTPSHLNLIGRIEKMTQSKIKEGKIPSRKELGELKVAKLFERFQAVKSHKRAEELLTSDWAAALEAMPKNEVAARLLVLTFPEIFAEKEKSTVAQLPGAERFESRDDHQSRRRGFDSRDRGAPRRRGFDHREDDSSRSRYPRRERPAYPREERRDEPLPWQYDRPEVVPAAALPVARVSVRPLAEPVTSERRPGPWKINVRPVRDSRDGYRVPTRGKKPGFGKDFGFKKKFEKRT